jgi:hypothetical protein
MSACARPQSCEVARCGCGVVFTVDHPQRGELGVCDYHARQIREAFGIIEVDL